MTVIDVVDRILARMKSKDLAPIIKNEASLEIREQFLDCTKARETLGWEATYNIREGLTRTIPWYREHLKP